MSVKKEKGKEKRKCGDRRDGKLIRDADSMHRFMPYILPNRTDNEAVLNDEIIVDKLVEYIAAKNATSPAFKYTVFHAILAAISKTCYLRPKMNNFYQAFRYYRRNDITLSFVVKKEFSDKSEEAMAMLKIDKESEQGLIGQIHDKIEKFVTKVRKHGENDGATDIITTLVKLPRFLLRFVTWLIYRLEYHDMLPKSFVESDPYHATCFVSNLGSIKATASYHHLANFGTNSIFMVIGEMKNHAMFGADGQVETHTVLPINFTVDERIADGFYFAKSLKLFKHLLQNPELLDLPLTTPVDFDVDKKVSL